MVNMQKHGSYLLAAVCIGFHSVRIFIGIYEYIFAHIKGELQEEQSPFSVF